MNYRYRCLQCEKTTVVVAPVAGQRFFCQHCGNQIVRSNTVIADGSPICAHCQKPVEELDDIVCCPSCGAAIHFTCWQQTGRCEACGFVGGTVANPSIDAVAVQSTRFWNNLKIWLKNACLFILTFFCLRLQKYLKIINAFLEKQIERTGSADILSPSESSQGPDAPAPLNSSDARSEVSASAERIQADDGSDIPSLQESDLYSEETLSVLPGQEYVKTYSRPENVPENLFQEPSSSSSPSFSANGISPQIQASSIPSHGLSGSPSSVHGSGLDSSPSTSPSTSPLSATSSCILAPPPPVSTLSGNSVHSSEYNSSIKTGEMTSSPPPSLSQTVTQVMPPTPPPIQKRGAGQLVYRYLSLFVNWGLEKGRSFWEYMKQKCRQNAPGIIAGFRTVVFPFLKSISFCCWVLFVSGICSVLLALRFFFIESTHPGWKWIALGSLCLALLFFVCRTFFIRFVFRTLAFAGTVSALVILSLFFYVYRYSPDVDFGLLCFILFLGVVLSVWSVGVLVGVRKPSVFLDSGPFRISPKRKDHANKPDDSSTSWSITPQLRSVRKTASSGKSPNNTAKAAASATASTTASTAGAAKFSKPSGSSNNPVNEKPHSFREFKPADDLSVVPVGLGQRALASILFCLGLGAFLMGSWFLYKHTDRWSFPGYLASKGVADAQYLCGMNYLDEKTPNRDPIEAFALIRSAAEQKYTLANQQAGQMYFEGIGTDRDYQAAFDNWDQAAKARNLISMVRLGDCYSNGYGTSEEPIKAANWYLKAAERNSSEGQYKLAQAYFNGWGVSVNNFEGLRWLEHSAISRYPDALFLLGKIKIQGELAAKDISGGIASLEAAVAEGCEEASEYLADFYLSGDGLELAPQQAISWLSNAAKEGDQSAEKRLDRFFLEEDGLRNNPEQGVQWLTIRANADEPQAQFRLARCCLEGMGTEKDPVLGFHWLIKAAEAGLAEAQYEAGRRYYEGQDTEKNPEEAIVWLGKSAKQDNIEAQYLLGRCFFEGTGVQTDRPQGAQWFFNAAQTGDRKSTDELNAYFIDGSGLNEAPQLGVKWLEYLAENGNLLAKQKLEQYYNSDLGLQNDPVQAIRLLRNRAESGDTDAQAKYGECCLSGIGTSRDCDEAVKWLEKSALKDHAKAKLLLDNYTLNGDGLDQTPEFAQKWLAAMAEQGSIEAMTALGNYYLAKGNRRYRNPDRGMHFLQQAADKNSGEAQQTLSLFVLNGSGLDEAPAASLQWLERPLQKENSAAQLKLGECYQKGTGTYIDQTKAVKHFRTAAELGNAQAQFELGVCLAEGKGEKASPEESYSWFVRSAKQGHAQAQYEAGTRAIAGTGTVINQTQGAQWLRKASDSGISEAQFAYGKCCQTGCGCPKNLFVAASCFQKSAQQGHSAAALEYGKCCKQGLGVPIDLTGAARSFKQAAGKGNQEAAYELAQCYMEGKGVSQDVDQGITLLEQGSQEGNKEAQVYLANYYMNSSEAFNEAPEKTTQWLRLQANAGNQKAEQKLITRYIVDGNVKSTPRYALDWLIEAADRDNPQAQLQLAKYYWSDYSMAKRVFSWALKASQNGTGLPEAIYLLGACYRDGLGTDVRMDHAKKCFLLAEQAGYEPASAALKEMNDNQLRTAAQSNDPKAQVEYGRILLYDDDKKAAVYWFQKAADQNYAEGQYMLGLCYYNGWGMDGEQVSKAVALFRKAAEQGYHLANKKLEEVLAKKDNEE